MPSAMNATTLVAVATCHNRRRHTLTCLKGLYAQSLPPDTILDVILVDDGSTDGTKQAVRARFPDVTVLDGTGDLYWAGGMRVGFAQARTSGADAILWINDDTRLHPGALQSLMTTSRLGTSHGRARIAVGTTVDPETKRVTYGGRVRSSRWHPFRYDLLRPSGRPLPCDVMNGNAVLIPAEIADHLGNLDAGFTHGIADYDYALRARKAGFEVVVAPDIIGTCRKNAIQGTWEDASLPITDRWTRMHAPTGLPIREWGRFARRHGGPFWPIFVLLPLLRLLLLSARPLD